MSETGKLTLVATPIGNLGDLTRRAEQALQEADLILAEDTRHSKKLLNHLGLAKPMLSFFEGNWKQRIPQVLARIKNGERLALVTDGGSPIISDPGYELVYACLEEELSVEALPGPCAAILALQLSGLPPDRIIIESFLPRKGKARTDRIAGYRQLAGTLVIYESPKRLIKTLNDLLDELGDVQCAVLREMTKLFEEHVRGPLSYAIDHFSQQGVKGEVSIVVRLPGPPDVEVEQAMAGARRLRKEMGMKTGDAAKATALITGVNKKTIYQH